jgi:hypothetical protein
MTHAPGPIGYQISAALNAVKMWYKFHPVIFTIIMIVVTYLIVMALIKLHYAVIGDEPELIAKKGLYDR